MGIFNKLFSSASSENWALPAPWMVLSDASQLDSILMQSETKPQLIFKHSTRCGISSMVLNQFKADYKLSEARASLYYLDLLTYREISNEVASRLEVLHQSPQLLIIKNGICVKHASHGAINDLDLETSI